MRIYSMTATFGKLEHETLTLQPGLNIIEAPNEWGKSTWCAFLAAMLYGIDTRERTTQELLAQKERYAPWSGSPMSGRMELQWNGRNITIERSTKGRSIFGVFRAYETDTGLDIPELTAANCGEQLLGVEKSVFLRAGFLKLSDLPVTEDAALWRRLNALVTTGDESGASDKLEQKLRDLKNQCMSNRSNGLIPQVLRQKQELEGDLSRLQELNAQKQHLTERQQQLEVWHADLTNHQAVLAYEAARSNAQRLEQAQLAQAQAEDVLKQLQRRCAGYPERWVLEKQQHTLNALREEAASLRMEEQMLPAQPQVPAEDTLYGTMTAQEAVTATEADRHSYEKAKKDPRPLALTVFSLLFLIGFVVCLFLIPESLGPICMGVLFLLSAVLTIVSFVLRKRCIQALIRKYGSSQPDDWTRRAVAYGNAQNTYQLALARWKAAQEEFMQRKNAFQQRLQSETGGKDLQSETLRITQSLRDLDALEAARREMLRAENHAQTLQALTQPVPLPEKEDPLTHTKEQTDRLLADCVYEQRQIEKELARCGAQMDALGDEPLLREKLQKLDGRLALLKATYSALELAQDTLSRASEELQRRFAPRLSQRTQEIFGKLTAQRYQRLTLDKNLAVQISAENEDTLREARWRSDGTVDQLYLALRLAVAEELTPHVPLVLDDALVRFDDTRLQAAIQILKQIANTKQILLFTCQSREQRLAQAD